MQPFIHNPRVYTGDGVLCRLILTVIRPFEPPERYGPPCEYAHDASSQPIRRILEVSPAFVCGLSATMSRSTEPLAALCPSAAARSSCMSCLLFYSRSYF